MTDTFSTSPGERDSEVRAHFHEQAKVSDAMGSPLTAAVCRIIADTLDTTTATGRRTLEWPGSPRPDVLSLRLAGGLHRLVLGGHDADLVAAYPPHPFDEERLRRAVLGALLRHDAALCEALDAPPQTNEIGRSAMLYPGLLTVARETGLPLDVREIGSSAGLNLLFDRFNYRYGDDAAGWDASPVKLAPETRGRRIPLDGTIEVRSREGSDIAPIRLSDPAARLRLRSFVWPDQTARLQRLDHAISLVDHEPYVLTQSDAADFVRAQFAARQPGAAFVLFHSIMWQYMPDATKRDIENALDTAGASATRDAPLAWLRMEPADNPETGATLSLTLWPDGRTRRLARCDYHGRWIEWL